jgi:hypothetical protein
MIRWAASPKAADDFRRATTDCSDIVSTAEYPVETAKEAAQAFALRIVENLRRRTGLSDPTLFEEHDVMRYIPNEEYLMAHQKHGHSGLGESLHDTEDFGYQFRIKGRGNFVEQQKARPHRYSASDRNALLLTAG